MATSPDDVLERFAERERERERALEQPDVEIDPDPSEMSVEEDEETCPEAEGFALQPVGWRVLVRLIPVERTHRGVIEKAPETIRAQEYLRTIGEVVAIGPQAYKAEQFSGEPWCTVGDMVGFGSNAGISQQEQRGQRIIHYKILNDDEILATVERPDDIVTPL